MNIEKKCGNCNIALCHFDNFYVSCERLLHPRLKGAPVIVTSYIWKHIISRSNEAKQLKIPMGQDCAWGKYDRILDAKNVCQIHTNWESMQFYKKVSASVVSILAQFTNDLEQCYIDEVFIVIPEDVTNPVEYCEHICSEVMQKCGIPITIGISPNKTLSKLAINYAKRHYEIGRVICFDKGYYENDQFMSHFNLRDINGIGRHTQKELSQAGIKTVQQFLSLDEKTAKERLGQRVFEIFCELHGKVLKKKANERKMICLSQNFTTRVKDKVTLLQTFHNLVKGAIGRFGKLNAAAHTFCIYLRTEVGEGTKYHARKIMFIVPEKIETVLNYYVDDSFSYDECYMSDFFRPHTVYNKVGVEIEYMTSDEYSKLPAPNISIYDDIIHINAFELKQHHMNAVCSKNWAAYQN